MNLSEFISRRRSDRGLSIQGLATASGMSKGGVHSLETGATIDPSASTILAVARGLKVKPEIVLAAARESLEAAKP